MSVYSPIRVKNFFSAISIIAMFLAGGCVYPATPIDGRNLGNNTVVQARTKLLAAAESYLGTPYRYGGADSRGVDCSGLVFLSFKDALNIQVPRSSAGLYSWTERITVAEMRPGDLVFFNTSGRGVSHVGIYIGDNRFIHAPSEGSITGVTYNNLDESYYKRTFVGAGRAIPWDSEAEQTFTNGPSTAGSSGNTSSNASSSQTAILSDKPWAQSTGLFAGLGFGSALGGFIDGSVFRGLSLQAKAGYKGLFGNPSLQISLEARATWDKFLGIYRFPFVLAIGSDTFQIFAGPAFVIGEPIIESNQRAYHSDFSWLGEVGVSFAFQPMPVPKGAVSLYSEIAWQSYNSNDGQETNIMSDIAANLRFSIGLRYLSIINIK